MIGVEQVDLGLGTVAVVVGLFIVWQARTLRVSEMAAAFAVIAVGIACVVVGVVFVSVALGADPSTWDLGTYRVRGRL